MSHPNLTRSLLALAIASASFNVTATTITLSEEPMKLEGKTYDSLTVTGRYIGKPEFEGDGFDFYNSTVKGNLIVDAHIETEEVNGLNAQAFQTEDNAKIHGDLINRGHLEVRGLQTEALELNRTTIDGNLINEGKIIAKGGALIPFYEDTDINSGLVVRETSVGKDIHNKGSILASVTDVNPNLPAINSQGINIEGASIGGSVTNSGTITVKNEQAIGNASGILIQDHKLTIDDDEVVPPYRATTITGQVKNSGTITATGENAVGVRIGNGVTLEGGVHNTGTIHGDNVGIQLDGTNTTVNITQAGGLIKGHDYAINQGKSTANLTLTGGEIDGKLNVTSITVEGAGTINADEVTAKQLTVSNSGHLTLTQATQLNTALHLAGGEVTSDALIVNSGKEITVSADSTINAANVTADKVTVSNGSLLTLSQPTQLNTDLTLAGSGIHANEFTLNNLEVLGNSHITANNVTINSDKLTVSQGNQLNLQGKSGTLKLNVADLTFQNGAVIGLELTPEQDNSQPIVNVDGNLVFESGSTVSLSAVKGLKLNNDEYLLIQAKEISADSEGLVQGTALLKVNSYENLNGLLSANVSVVHDPAATIKAIGASKNAQAAASQMLGLIESLEQSDNLDNQAFAHMLLTLNDAELKKTAEQMTPDMHDGAIAVANLNQNLISNVTASRTAAIRGQSSGGALAETGVWMQGLYNNARQGSRNAISGYNAYTSGIALGADTKVTDNLTVGAAYGYMDSTVNSKRGNTTEVDGHSLTLYAGYELENYFVDSNLTYSKNNNESKRHIADTAAKGKYDSNTLGLRVIGGYDFQLDNMTLSPLVGVNYSNTKLDSFTEKGSPAALRTGSQRYEVIELGAGARLAASYPLGQGRLEPQAQAMIYHDFAADSTKSTSAFVNAIDGGSFIAYGAKPVRTSYQASLGADYKVGAFTVGGSYVYTGKKDFNADTFTAKVRYDF